MKHSQKFRALRRTERVLWIAGALLVGFAAAGLAHRALLQRHDVEAFNRASMSFAMKSSTRTDHLDVPPPDRSDWSDGRIDAWQSARLENDEVPLALLKIPTIDLIVAVHGGTDELSLNRGVGWIEGTAPPGGPGNVAIAGHRDGFFRGLQRIAVGDHIELETLEGSHVYEVEDLRIVDPDAVEVLRRQPQPAITLVTCYPFYWIGSAPQRFIVRGRRLETQPDEFATGEINDNGAHTAAP